MYVVWVQQHGECRLFLTRLILSLSDGVVVHAVYVGMYFFYVRLFFFGSVELCLLFNCLIVYAELALHTLVSLYL